MNFTQMIAFKTDDPATLVEMARGWDEMQAEADVMGYAGSRVLADRDRPGHYMLVADFAVVDPDVSAADEAAKNNDRPETQLWAQKLLDIITEGEPVYSNFDEIYRTG
jgi:hypothetical protein